MTSEHMHITTSGYTFIHVFEVAILTDTLNTIMCIVSHIRRFTTNDTISLHITITNETNILGFDYRSVVAKNITGIINPLYRAYL